MASKSTQESTQEQGTQAAPQATYTYGPVSGKQGYSYVYLGAGEGKVLLGMAQRTGTTAYVAHVPEGEPVSVPNGGRGKVAEVLHAAYAAAQAPAKGKRGKAAKAQAAAGEEWVPNPAPALVEGTPEAEERKAVRAANRAAHNAAARRAAQAKQAAAPVVEPKQEQAPKPAPRKQAQAAPKQEQAAPLTGPGNMRPKAAEALHNALAVLREHWGTPLSCREVEERLGYPGKTVAGLLLRATRVEGNPYGVKQAVAYYPHTNTGGREYKGGFVYVGTPEEQRARNAELREARKAQAAAKQAAPKQAPARTSRKQGK